MSKCRMLIQENQELGRQLSQGRIAQLEAELALQKKYSEELKSSQDELNDFIIQLDEEVEGMQSTILTLQQQLKDTRHQLTQQPQGQSATATTGPAGPSRTAPPSPSTSSDPGSQTELAASGSVGGKDCGRVPNGPANGSGGGGQRGGVSSGAAALYREGGSSVDEDFPPSPSAMSSPPQGECSKLSNHSEEAASGGSGSGAGQVAGGDRLERQLSVGYESVDSPTGSEASAALHSNDTDSNADAHEAPAVAKGSRTAGPRHAAAASSASGAAHNGLDSTATVATAAGSATPTSSTGSVL